MHLHDDATMLVEFRLAHNALRDVCSASDEDRAPSIWGILGVEIGVTDVILPSDVRELLNKIVEAWIGATHFKMKTLGHVGTAMALRETWPTRASSFLCLDKSSENKTNCGNNDDERQDGSANECFGGMSAEEGTKQRSQEVQRCQGGNNGDQICVEPRTNSNQGKQRQRGQEYPDDEVGPTLFGRLRSRIEKKSRCYC